MSEKYVFGIDLGTTYSCISYVDDTGHAVILQNSEGKNITPSVVQIQEDGDVVVGEVAKEGAITEEESTVQFAKRHMGEEGFKYDINGSMYSPEEISGYILKKFVKDVKDSTLGAEVKDVVITCPAYFGAAERLATQDAGKIAGLNVMEIIKEPLAAAIHFGVTSFDESKNYMVFDLGGGTFDVTIMRIGGGSIEEICSDGDHQLGGKDWDDCLINYLKEAYLDKVGVDYEFTPYDEQSIRQTAEDTKKRLSSKPEALARITTQVGSEAIQVTRETFDTITESLLDRTFDITDQAIEVARQRGVSIDGILLVGGSTRMPQVHDAIVSKYGIEPKSHEPDEAVAKGAALYAVNVYVNNQKKLNDWGDDTSKDEAAPQIENPDNYKEDLNVDVSLISGGTRPISITTAATKSYGVAVLSNNDPNVEEIKNMIFKNSPMPDGSLEQKETFGVAFDNQTCVLIRIFESDYLEERYEYDEELLVGKAELLLPGNLPSGAPVEITLSLDNQGLLKVYGKDLTTGNEVRTELRVAGSLSAEELTQAQKRSSSTQIKAF